MVRAHGRALVIQRLGGSKIEWSELSITPANTSCWKLLC